jgi:hypothetical protein
VLVDVELKHFVDDQGQAHEIATFEREIQGIGMKVWKQKSS